MIDDAELLARLVAASRETAGLLLEEQGGVSPFALTISGDGQDLRGMFPIDDHPDAGAAELIGLVAAHVRRSAVEGRIAGAALVAQSEPGAASAIRTQVVTPSQGVSLVYAFRKGAAGWIIDEATSSEDPVVREPLF